MPTSTKSTSLAWATGRRRSTFIVASRPSRIDAIIPEAPQRSAISETSPMAESGVAICSIDFLMPSAENGSTSSSSLITRLRSSSSWRTSPNTETRRIVSGTIEKRTW